MDLLQSMPIPHGDVTLRCLVGGAGPTVVLLHGFPDTPDGWSDLVPRLLDAGYRVVAPYLRGYTPESVSPTATASSVTTLDELARDVIAVLDALDTARAVVVGHDWGAATAYLVASRHPDRVEGLVGVGLPHPATVRPTWRVLWYGRHFLTLRLWGAARRMRARQFALVDRLVRRWSPTWQFAHEETDAVKGCFAHPPCLDAALGYYRGVDSRRTRELLRPHIQAPTLVIAGDDDPALPVEAYRQAGRKFDGPYEVQSFPGGHFVHRESPEEVAASILEFIRRTSRPDVASRRAGSPPPR